MNLTNDTKLVPLQTSYKSDFSRIELPCPLFPANCAIFNFFLGEDSIKEDLTNLLDLSV